MAVLARASGHDIVGALRDAPPLPPHDVVRGPEVGLVMARGRQGSDGDAFNLGEVPVTRCTVRLDDGAVGHAYAIGRDAERAVLAAVLDAALQDARRRPALLAAVIAPLAAAQAARAAALAARAAATRVEFQAMASMR
jgi:alpha-D-ribose 1-methylphosphonate 5-triphosphate synthase subunit PhnG